ncbi:arf-GAP with dual PH domain-containing protein 1 isoform X4 [Nerophis ophidion]|uniref:arf-GAP with dual PH domain-containing protein 1 isoform X4 n=1 Tax=Nerophis ophidion TaxID=159077 RepID=UPI002AE0147F|nr:arf-GAP with dual PH domain-containing protein 1 isoform X4 [Nerophis ophidion]
MAACRGRHVSTMPTTPSFYHAGLLRYCLLMLVMMVVLAVFNDEEGAVGGRPVPSQGHLPVLWPSCAIRRQTRQVCTTSEVHCLRPRRTSGGGREETHLGRPPPPPHHHHHHHRNHHASHLHTHTHTHHLCRRLLTRRLRLSAMSLKALREILQRPGNDTCADCGAPDPDWSSTSLGVFICLACSGIHRNIPEVSKVKSLSLSHWEDHEVQFMADHGNELMKRKYEAAVPVYYYKPSHRDCQVLKEQWIRAKYERKEFTNPEWKFTYEQDTRDGALMKRGRDNGQFLSRRFVLSAVEGTLKYFTKYDAKEPKAVIKVDSINATFQPEKIGHHNGMQITYLKDYNTRNIFLYHDNGKDIVDWFNSIRAVQLHYLKVAFPGASDAELVPKLTRNFLKEGYMEKTGPRQTEGFKKRWFTLDQRRLMYYKDPLDAFAKGEVFLGSKDNYGVAAGLPAGTYCNGAWQHGITMVTPERCFLFTCETEAEQQDWLKHFNEVISTQMSPQEYTMEAMFKHRY